MRRMRVVRMQVFGLSVAYMLLPGVALAQEFGDLHDHAAMHAASGREAAALSPGYANLCDLEMAFRNVNRLKSDPPRVGSSSTDNTASTEVARPRAASSSRQQGQTLPPMRVFDNLYFVGSAGVASWLLGTDDGYILIDAMNTDDDAKSIIEAGIVALGLDPSQIKYLLITHAHGDHFGGYKYIKDTYGPRIAMSETDWQLASQLQEHPRFGLPPARDLSVEDGDQLSAGVTTVDIHVTPGHTLGTISPVFTVYDNGEPYRAVLWGGTGFNFGPNYEQMNAYAASATRMREVADEQDIQVFLANHPRRDGASEKMQLLAQRAKGDSHPFVDRDFVHASLDVLRQCALAQADRIEAGDL